MTGADEYGGEDGVPVGGEDAGHAGRARNVSDAGE